MQSRSKYGRCNTNDTTDKRNQASKELCCVVVWHNRLPDLCRFSDTFEQSLPGGIFETPIAV